MKRRYPLRKKTESGEDEGREVGMGQERGSGERKLGKWYNVKVYAKTVLELPFPLQGGARGIVQREEEEKVCFLIHWQRSFRNEI